VVAASATAPADAAVDVPSAVDDDLEDASAARRIPFGPFLALGALEFLFFGDRIVAWYTALVG
jgi:leader peptidase (prepilin peptidase)/N-methyltransferase